MAELTVPRVDFSSLGELPAIIRQNQADALRRQTLASLGQGGAADADALLRSGDMSLAQLGLNLRNRQDDMARQAARDKILDTRADREFSANQDYRTRALAIQEANAKRRDRTVSDDAAEREIVATRLGLERGSPAFNSYVATGKMGRDEGLTAGDRKVINEAEDELPTIQGTRESLKRALDLNDKTFSGFGAGARASIGSNLPDALVPNFIADKATADATTEWQKLMAPEALQTMANTLKGATTDFELRKFTEMLADPTTKPEIRKQIINRLDTLAARKEELAKRRINDLRGGTYYKPRAAAPAASGQGSGADTMLQQARDAIAAGAPRDAVIQRLQGAGIDPSGL
jgi:hypothetical protein